LPASTTTTSSAPPQPAAIDRRILAAVIDMAVVLVLLIVYTMLFGESKSTGTGDSKGFTVNLDGAAFWGFVALGFLYNFALEAVYGRTLGKLAAGLRVVAINNGSLPPKVLLRTLCRLVDGLPAFYLVGFLVMLTNKNRQRIGDLAGGTLVTRA
jgi:uncharacterized RDD family membrane protein YckC